MNKVVTSREQSQGLMKKYSPVPRVIEGLRNSCPTEFQIYHR